MTKMKIGGIVLTGFGAYLIISKALNVVSKAVSDISDAAKWKAYYKAFGKDVNASIEGIVDPNQRKVEQESEKRSTSSEAIGDAVADVIKRTINTIFDVPDAPESPENGLKTHSESTDEGNSEELQVTDEIKPQNDYDIYRITDTSFYNDEKYDKVGLYWVEDDDVFLDEDEMTIVPGVNFLIGNLDVKKIFQEVGEVYVRNDKLKTDYRVTLASKASLEMADNVPTIHVVKDEGQ